MDTLEVTSKPLVKMSRAKKKILEAKGYKVTDSAEWLGLSREEAQIVDGYSGKSGGLPTLLRIQACWSWEKFNLYFLRNFAIRSESLLTERPSRVML